MWMCWWQRLVNVDRLDIRQIQLECRALAIGCESVFHLACLHGQCIGQVGGQRKLEVECVRFIGAKHVALGVRDLFQEYPLLLHQGLLSRVSHCYVSLLFRPAA